MPIGPAAKGIIIVGGVIIAAGIAVYENPQVREWIETNRRKASDAFNEWLDSVDPQRRRRAHAYGAPGEEVRGDATRTRGDSPVQNEEIALERRRRGEEYLEERRRRMEEMKERKRRASDEAREAAGQEDRVAGRGTAVEVQEGTDSVLRQRGHNEAPSNENERDDSPLNVDNAHIQISLSQSDFLPSVPAEQPSEAAAAAASRSTETPAKDEPSTPRLSAQTPSHAAPEFTTPTLCLNQDDTHADDVHSHTPLTPASATHNTSSQPLTPSTIGSSDMYFSRAPSDDGDVDMMSDAGASHMSRVSSFGHINEMDARERVDDDVMSVASSWSAVSSRVSER